MAQVAVEKVDGMKSAPGSISDDLNALIERVRQRAFELFQRRGGVDGFDLDDWFAAEQDLLQIPQSELIEKDGTFQVRLSAPGFKVEDVKVIAQAGRSYCEGFREPQTGEKRGKRVFQRVRPEDALPAIRSAPTDSGRSSHRQSREWRAPGAGAQG